MLPDYRYLIETRWGDPVTAASPIGPRLRYAAIGRCFDRFFVECLKSESGGFRSYHLLRATPICRSMRPAGSGFHRVLRRKVQRKQCAVFRVLSVTGLPMPPVGRYRCNAWAMQSPTVGRTTRVFGWMPTQVSVLCTGACQLWTCRPRDISRWCLPADDLYLCSMARSTTICS